jgi:hypothetical protein
VELCVAVRTYLHDPDRRVTRDVDLLVPSQALPGFRELLEEQGYRLYCAAPWWHAERGSGETRELVDIAVDQVVDMASFERYPLDPQTCVLRSEPGGSPIPVPIVEDLLALKLLAHRDKDLLDAVALLRDQGAHIDRARLFASIKLRDLEIPIRRGQLALLAAVESGALARLWEQRLGEPLDAAHAVRVVGRLRELFR